MEFYFKLLNFITQKRIFKMYALEGKNESYKIINNRSFQKKISTLEPVKNMRHHIWKTSTCFLLWLKLWLLTWTFLLVAQLQNAWFAGGFQTSWHYRISPVWEPWWYRQIAWLTAGFGVALLGHTDLETSLSFPVEDLLTFHYYLHRWSLEWKKMENWWIGWFEDHFIFASLTFSSLS